MTYYNTVKETGQTLMNFEVKARTQDEKILKHFTEHPKGDYSPSEVHNLLGLRCPLTSTRRAMSTLTGKGLLERTENTVKGLYQRNENTWKLA